MNGKRYLLDTNTVIQLLAGNPSLRKMVEDSDFLAISVISKLEFLSYPDLTEDEKIAVARNWRSHRRKSFKFLYKTPYQIRSAVKCVVFRYTRNKTLHILSNFCHTFCDSIVTDCAREFAV